MEYLPSRSQCQTYTATPAKGVPPFARSWITSSRSMGTPSAVPLDSPKLERMSLRTIPLCSRTSGPFEPSPGYGPAVSSGISPVAVDPADVAADELDEFDEVLPVPLPHAAKPTAATPNPRARSICRRLISVATSKPSPWSTTSSSGRVRGRPSYVSTSSRCRLFCRTESPIVSLVVSTRTLRAHLQRALCLTCEVPK